MIQLLIRLLILLFFSTVSSNDQCYNDLTILYEERNLTIEDKTRYYIEKDTLRCYKKHEGLKSEQSDDPSACPSTLATINVSPKRVIPEDRLQLPWMTANITVDVMEEFQWVVLQFECLQASDIEDGYCHKKSSLVHYDGKTIQPCRFLNLNGSKPIFPLLFSYNCFRIFGFSQYRVNVTFYPQNCRTTVLFTLPSIGDIYPEIMQFYHNQNITYDQQAEWSPLLIVDSTPVDGVWFRFATPQNYTWREMRISIAERSDDDKILGIVKEFVVPNPATGIKWESAPKGSYSAIAYIQRHDCLLICNNAPNCRVCSHTPINFTLDENKGSVSWKTLRAVRDAGIYVILILLGIVVSVGVGGFAVLNYIRRRNIKNPLSYELTERPKVLMIFADDCQEHTDVVLQLAASLEKLANGRVLVDQEELLVSGEKPSRWLLSSLSSSSKVLIVVSPSVPFLLENENLTPSKSLIQRRPFPDLFPTAIDMITSEISMKSNRDRFAIVRLPYSPITPPHLALLGLRGFEVPTDMMSLTSFLHGVQATCVSHPHEEEERQRMQEVIAKFLAMSSMKPDWLDERLIDKKSDMTSIEIEDIPYQRETSNHSLKNSDEGLGLMEPAESDEEFDDHNHHQTARMQLIEPSDSDTE